MAIEAIVKKWGNSMGVILPKEVLQNKGLKEKDRVLIEVVKEADFSGDFGALRGVKISAQQFKDMVRRGWDS